jgi:hypothetical protein
VSLVVVHHQHVHGIVKEEEDGGGNDDASCGGGGRQLYLQELRPLVDDHHLHGGGQHHQQSSSPRQIDVMNNNGGAGVVDGLLHVPSSSSTPQLALSNASSVACAGCRGRIMDRFFLQAVDLPWHVACLKCCQCGLHLEGALTCFARHGRIYCKDDYYR